MSIFEHDHVEYIDGVETASGKRIKLLNEKRCFRCGCKVAGLHYIEVDLMTAPPRREKLLTLFPFGTTKRVSLSDGSFADIDVCHDCEPLPIDIEEHGHKIGQQIVRGHLLEKQANGHSADELRNHAVKYSGLRAVGQIPKHHSDEEAHKIAVLHAEAK